jgi:hypothetical protein
MTDKNTPAIAFIGLGSMGLGMAKNLLKHGHKVVGVDPSAAAREAFKAAGGTIADTPAAAAAMADVVIVAVVNDKQVEAVLFGDKGAASTLRKGCLVMQCATVPAAFARFLASASPSGHELPTRQCPAAAPVPNRASSRSWPRVRPMPSPRPRAFSPPLRPRSSVSATKPASARW